MVVIGNAVDVWQSSAIAFGLVVTVIVLAGLLKWVAFIPGTFVGMYSYFAINFDWKLLASTRPQKIRQVYPPNLFRLIHV